MPVRTDPNAVIHAPRPRGPVVTTPTPATPAAAPVTPASPRGASDNFDTTRPRADGSLLLGKRTGGPGEVSLSKKGELLLEGKAGTGARIETAHLIEMGLSPFAHASPTQGQALIKELTGGGAAKAEAKPSSTGPLLARSASATVLLSLARTSDDAPTRDAALTGYVKMLAGEPNLQLRGSMLTNLDFTRLPLPAGTVKKLEAARAELLPTHPPYDEWFKGAAKPKLEIRHYVMDEFWKSELSAWKKRGFEVVKDSANTIELRGTVADPTGKQAGLPMHVVMKKSETDVLRDMDDKSVNMILYSGHAQLGGVVDGSLGTAPAKMNGTKLVQLFNCRGKQTESAFHAKFPEAHVTNTWSSAYSEDDVQVLTATLKTIAARGDYSDVRAQLHNAQMIQPKTNYMLPDDARNLSQRDDDHDGINDLSAIGPDRFFDPGRLATRGGANVFTPAALHDDPQALSGAKLDHAVGYANTAFFYFAEENHAAPITKPNADKMIPGGWFVGPPDEKVRITEKKKDGETWYSVAVNSAYASRSREVITSTVLIETEKYLATQEHGKVTETDMLRGLMLVGGYLDLFVNYSDTINEVLDGFSKANGFKGVNYDVFYAASEKDGHEGTATPAALAYLKAHGVTVKPPV